MLSGNVPGIKENIMEFIRRFRECCKNTKHIKKIENKYNKYLNAKHLIMSVLGKLRFK